MDRGIIEKAYSVRAICDVSVGYNNVDIAAARERKIWVTHTPDVLTDATANLTWALILGATRRVAEGDRLIRKGGWTGFRFDFLLGSDLAGKQLGIIGMGRIGQAVARRAAAFGMEVAYVPSARRRKRPVSRFDDGLRATPMPFDELMRTSDVVAVHCPLTPETHHLIDTRALSLMKPTSYLVNVARGRWSTKWRSPRRCASTRSRAPGSTCSRTSRRSTTTCSTSRTSCCCRTSAARPSRRGPRWRSSPSTTAWPCCRAAVRRRRCPS
jgi:lactate dehydrogenase-like 2-hydroxyacid dehydrogenase